MRHYSVKKDGYVFCGSFENGSFSELEIFPELASRFVEADAALIANRGKGEVFLNESDFEIGIQPQATYENMWQFTN